MFGMRKEPHSDDSVDVNDFIVSDNTSQDPTASQRYDQESPLVYGIEDVNDTIIEADFSEDRPLKKRFKTSQVLILGATGLFAVGGVATLFLPSKSAPSPITVASIQEVEPPKAHVSMPDNLAFPPITTSNPVPANSPKVVATDPAQTAQAPQVSEPAPAAEHSSPPVNPIAAQTADAQKLTSTAAPEAGASPTIGQPTPKAAPNAAEPTPKPATKQPATQSAPAPAPSIKKEVAAEPAPKPVPAGKQSNQENTTVSKASDQSTETIKKLVAITPEAFGLQSIQEGSLTLEASHGSTPQRLGVGDRLPSGEHIVRIDARSMTLVTDRSVIRFN